MLSSLRSSLRSATKAAPPGLRFYAKPAAAITPGNKASTKQIAAQRERALAQAQIKRAEQKRMARLRLEARRPLDTPLFLDTATAIRYLRAAEVGHPAQSTTLTLTVRVIANNGVQALSGSVRLPRGLDANQRIAVFTLNPELADAARAAGAAVVGGEELIEQVKAGVIDFNKALATPDILPKLNPIARTLGPKGLMPSARRGTVSNDIAKLIAESTGAIDFRQRSIASVSLPVAKAYFTDAEIVKNLIVAVDALRQTADRVISKQPVILGQATLSSTHGPGIVIDI